MSRIGGNWTRAGYFRFGAFMSHFKVNAIDFLAAIIAENNNKNAKPLSAFNLVDLHDNDHPYYDDIVILDALQIVSTPTTTLRFWKEYER